jgi:hypothetical protein
MRNSACGVLRRHSRVLRELSEPQKQLSGSDETFAEQDSDEISVLVAEGDEFAHCEIMSLDAPACTVSRVVVADGNYPLFPTKRQNSGLN